MNRTLLCALLTGALLLSGCASYRENQAIEAQKDGRLERAFKLTRSLARRGNAEAQFRLGLMFTSGQGVRKSQPRASEWLRKAALQGHVAARNKLSVTYLVGSGQAAAERDPDAERWMRESAEEGTYDTRYKLALLYFEGRIVEKDPDEGLHWLALAAADWPKQGRRLENRLRDDQLLAVTSEMGLLDAQYGMAQAFASGLNVPKSKSESAKWYYLAGSRGHAGAQNALGWIYSNGEGVPIDRVEAARWFAKAANQGHLSAQYQLGLMYERGFGIPLDTIQAHMWFNLAGSMGHQKSRDKRALMAKRLSASGLARAEELAVAWWNEHREASSDEESEP